MTAALRHGPQQILRIGGYARVGWSSRRGSNLFSVEKDRLTLRCLRAYSFSPDQLVRVERLPPTWLDGGVRIVHNRPDYPRDMTFYCRGGGDKVVELLTFAGFVPCGQGPAGRSGFDPWGRILLAAVVAQAIASLVVRMLHIAS